LAFPTIARVYSHPEKLSQIVSAVLVHEIEDSHAADAATAVQVLSYNVSQP
jgi:hypothetical protein